jgi:ABC-type sugar transport system permease subunit
MERKPIKQDDVDRATQWVLHRAFGEFALPFDDSIFNRRFWWVINVAAVSSVLVSVLAVIVLDFSKDLAATARLAVRAIFFLACFALVFSMITLIRWVLRYRVRPGKNETHAD